MKGAIPVERLTFNAARVDVAVYFSSSPPDVFRLHELQDALAELLHLLAGHALFLKVRLLKLPVVTSPLPPAY